uniref:Uncharacterized protein n=1 Tax=Mycena chlorophos TaxID=658473 RepID=A0ABQ0L998_MYCCL|nr:predicted protein [Mycena chlorophos]
MLIEFASVDIALKKGWDEVWSLHSSSTLIAAAHEYPCSKARTTTERVRRQDSRRTPDEREIPAVRGGSGLSYTQCRGYRMRFRGGIPSRLLLQHASPSAEHSSFLFSFPDTNELRIWQTRNRGFGATDALDRGRASKLASPFGEENSQGQRHCTRHQTCRPRNVSPETLGLAARDAILHLESPCPLPPRCSAGASSTTRAQSRNEFRTAGPLAFSSANAYSGRVVFPAQTRCGPVAGDVLALDSGRYRDFGLREGNGNIVVSEAFADHSSLQQLDQSDTILLDRTVSKTIAHGSADLRLDVRRLEYPAKDEDGLVGYEHRTAYPPHTAQRSALIRIRASYLTQQFWGWSCMSGTACFRSSSTLRNVCPTTCAIDQLHIFLPRRAFKVRVLFLGERLEMSISLGFCSYRLRLRVGWDLFTSPRPSLDPHPHDLVVDSASSSSPCCHSTIVCPKAFSSGSSARLKLPHSDTRCCSGTVTSRARGPRFDYFGRPAPAQMRMVDALLLELEVEKIRRAWQWMRGIMGDLRLSKLALLRVSGREWPSMHSVPEREQPSPKTVPANELPKINLNLGSHLIENLP